VRLRGRWIPRAEGLGYLEDGTGRVEVRLPERAEGPMPEAYALIALEGLWTGQAVEAQSFVTIQPSRRPPPWLEGPFHPPEKLRSIAEARSRLYRAVRSFFDSRGFIEVETPLLSPSPALQAHIEELSTRLKLADGSSLELYLSTSPEHPMKRLLAAGFERIYQISPFFRDGELTERHAPQFSGLEWYEAYTDYRDCMVTTEALVVAAAEAVAGSTTITYKGMPVDLKPPWERLTVEEAFRRELGIRLDPEWPAEVFRRKLHRAGLKVAGDDDWEACFFKAYIERVEPRLGLGRPTFVLDWPIRLSAMARSKPEDGRWCERFELYIAGLELGNAFSELTDPKEQRARFDKVAEARPHHRPDEKLLEALEFGLPPCSGMALGLDRLLMVLTDASTIAEVLLFPPHWEWSD
jgi:lysyl-tRNA synthetase class 2